MNGTRAGFLRGEREEPNNSIYAPLVGKLVKVFQDNRATAYGYLRSTSTMATHLCPYVIDDLCNIQPDGTTRPRIESETPLIIDTPKISNVHAITEAEFRSTFLTLASEKSIDNDAEPPKTKVSENYVQDFQI